MTIKLRLAMMFSITKRSAVIRVTEFLMPLTNLDNMIIILYDNHILEER